MKNTTVNIRGGNLLSGTVRIVPNKNAILPALTASILTNDEMSYHHVPRSPDVLKILATLTLMGASVRHEDENVYICCKNITSSVVPADHVSNIQAGYLFAGPLLARFGEATIPLSFGCRLGYRGHEDYAEYFRQLGVIFELKDKSIYFHSKINIKDDRLFAKEIAPPKRYATYEFASVVGTENILMMLAATSGFTSTISGIAQEPHVEQLYKLLRAMGANIVGQGSALRIIGSNRLRGTSFTPEADHVDYYGFATLAAMTTSDLLLEVPLPLSPGIIRMNEFLQQSGVVFEKVEKGVMVYGSKSLFEPSPTFPRAGEGMHKRNPGPWPSFPVDCLPSFIAWSTLNPDQATVVRSQNPLFTDGLRYVPILKEMGANVLFHDDQRVLVQGTSSGNPYMHSKSVSAPDVIEGARAVLMCALSGVGEYTIKNAQYILRRNPHFFDILKDLGAEIEVITYESTEELA